MSNEREPLLDGGDIQGNIIPGLNRPERYLVAFTCADRDRLRSVLALLRPQITTMREALTLRDERKRAFLTHSRVAPRSELWLNIALSARATEALGASGLAALDDDDLSFAGGMTPGLLGDAFNAVLSDGGFRRALRRAATS